MIFIWTAIRRTKSIAATLSQKETAKPAVSFLMMMKLENMGFMVTFIFQRLQCSLSGTFQYQRRSADALSSARLRCTEWLQYLHLPMEHIPMRKNGKKCYCGREGCMETICSLSSLLKKTESPDNFFAELRNGDAECMERWQSFLNNLAESINMLHLVYDTDFVLGGYLAPYLTDEDIAYLHEKINEQTPFEEDSDFIGTSHMPKHNIAIGAALPFIKDYIADAGLEV